LDDRGLKSFVKTSGGKGLHVVVPLTPKASWDAAKTFTGEIAASMAKARPDLYVATQSRSARRGKIFVDYFRNGRGATGVAAFSTRARPNVPISTPLAWDELSEGIRGDHFTIDNLPQRLDFLTSDPWPGFFKLKQTFELTAIHPPRLRSGMVYKRDARLKCRAVPQARNFTELADIKLIRR